MEHGEESDRGVIDCDLHAEANSIEDVLNGMAGLAIDKVA